MDTQTGAAVRKEVETANSRTSNGSYQIIIRAMYPIISRAQAMKTKILNFIQRPRETVIAIARYAMNEQLNMLRNTALARIFGR